jgi:hypothetical protein
MQQALGDQWQALAKPLQHHYTNDTQGKNIAEGHLTIDYPGWMQWPLHALRLFGALINRRGKDLPTRVVSQMDNGRQNWHRTVQFRDAGQIHFKSYFVLQEDRNELIEFTNPFLGIRVALQVDELGRLHYESNAYVLKLGKCLIPLSDRWLLGRAYILETANSDGGFNMVFRLKHTFLGEVFSYQGCFTTKFDQEEV